MPPDDPLIEEPPPRALRRHFAQHNSQALILSLFSLFVAAFLWGAIYLFTYWFALVGVTVSRSLDTQRFRDISDPDLLGPYFLPEFLCVALLVLVFASVLRRKVRPEKLREARHYLLWVLLELFMAVPNVTFAIGGNLSAMVHLRRRDMTKSWHLLRRIKESGGKLSMSSLRMEIEDDKTLDRVLFALQLVGLIGVREYNEGWFLFLQHTDAVLALWPPPNSNRMRTF